MAIQRATVPTLGILQLADTEPVNYGGAVSDPAAYPYPILSLQVSGSSSERVFAEDGTVGDAYVDAARELEQRGVTAITSNCGFAARLQPQVAAAVHIPVGLSSLLMVPLAACLVPRGSRIGIITYDSGRLSNRHFGGAGWTAEQIPVVIAGIEGSDVWRELKKPSPRPDPARVAETVSDVAGRLLRDHRDIRAIVLECSIFPMASPAVRRLTGLPTFDFISLAHLLMGAVDARPMQ